MARVFEKKIEFEQNEGKMEKFYTTEGKMLLVLVSYYMEISDFMIFLDIFTFSFSGCLTALVGICIYVLC